MNFIYARQSSKKQCSLTEQIEFISTYLTQNNITCHKIFQDIHSAWNYRKSESRPGFKKMVREISPNSTIYIYDVSRFSRNMLQATPVLKKLSTKNIHVYSISDSQIWDNNQQNKDNFLKSILNSQIYSSNLSHRVREKNSYLRSKGAKFGTPKFGEKAIKLNGIRKFVRNEDEIKLMIKIKSLWKYRMNYKLKTLQSFVDILNSSEIRIRSKKWTKSAVTRVVTSNKSYPEQNSRRIAKNFFEELNLEAITFGLMSSEVEEKDYYAECSDCKQFIQVDKRTYHFFKEDNTQFFCKTIGKQCKS